MAKRKSKFEEHIEEEKLFRKELNKTFNSISDHLTTTLNPMVKVKNGEEKEMLLGDAFGVLYEDNKLMKASVQKLDERTMILEDLLKMKEDWLSFKKRLKKFTKPIFKFLVWLSAVFIIGYFFYMWAAGKMTMTEIFKSTFDLFF